MICTAHQILFGDQIENEVGGACSAYGGEERRIQGCGGEILGKEDNGRPRRRWENNIKMNLQEVGCGVWTGSSWLRIGTGGGRLCGNEPSGPIKCWEFLD